MSLAADPYRYITTAVGVAKYKHGVASTSITHHHLPQPTAAVVEPLGMRHSPGHGVRVVGLQVVRAARVVQLERVWLDDVVALHRGQGRVALELQTAEHRLVLEVLEGVQQAAVVDRQPALLPRLAAVDVDLQVAGQRARVTRLHLQPQIQPSVCVCDVSDIGEVCVCKVIHKVERFVWW